MREELNRQRIVSKVRVSKKGIKSGGCQFSRGALYELLANPIFVGEIRHKQDSHPGLHEPILKRELWERVQHRLRETAARGAEAATRAIAGPLAGKIFDANGEPLYAQGAAKAGRRYRYYVSRRLVDGSHPNDERGWRLAAPEIERAVSIAARELLNDRAGVLEALQRADLESPDLRATLESTSAFCRRLEDAAKVAACIAELVNRVELLSLA
jgi:site-specific DNA recombinase